MALAQDGDANLDEVERGSGHKHKGSKKEPEYVDPHEGHGPEERNYIWEYVEKNMGKDCMKQCEEIQALNTEEHYSTVFCYDVSFLRLVTFKKLYRLYIMKVFKIIETFQYRIISRYGNFN